MNVPESNVNTRIALTIIENAEGPCCKRFRMGDDGKLRPPTSAAQIWSGSAALKEVAGLDDFLELRAKLASHQALTFGTVDRTAVGADAAPLVTREHVAPGKIARDRQHFSFAKGRPGIMMLDHDVRPGATQLDWHEVDAVIAKALPAIGATRRVWVPSSSSFVYTADGRELIGRGGWRCYFVVDDAATIPGVGAALYKALWKSGHGWILVSKSGRMLDRSIVDASVWQPERLDFAAPPDLGEGLVRRLPAGAPFVQDGAPMLAGAKHAGESLEAWRQSSTAIKKAKQELRPESEAKRKRFIATFGESERPAVRRAVDRAELCAEFKLVPHDGEPVTVAEILAKPGLWDGKRFADPLEPNYRGDTRIAWACLGPKDGSPYLFSHAHGGIRYALRVDDAPPADSGGFEERGGAIYGEKVVAGVPIQFQLANFTARIGETLHEDDGSGETHTHLRLTAWLRGQESTFMVPANEFAHMGWVIPNLGGGAIVAAGMGNADRLRAAIQTLSPDAGNRRTIYAHTGWRVHEEQNVYLHAGGAIGPDGSVDGLKAEFAGNMSALAGFALPLPPEGEDLRTAVRASLDLMDLGPLRITVPLLGAVYRAPLGSAAFVVWLAGLTGEGKSEVAALMQQHWGCGWSGKKHPGSWSSTGNALEGMLFTTKDALVSVDDYIPHKASKAVAEGMKAAAQRVIRNCGNQAGRQRMDATARLRATKPPRGLVLGTGEDVPEGASLNARMVVVEIQRGDLLPTMAARLTAAQQRGKEGQYAAAMAGYIRWLAPRLQEVQHRLACRVAEIRAEYAGAGHQRVADNLCELHAAWEIFIDFAVEVGAVYSFDDTAVCRVKTTLLQLAAHQRDHQVDNDPTKQFLDKIRSALLSDAAHLADRNTLRVPAGWELLGWREGPPDKEGFREPRPCGKKLGWLDAGGVYLEPRTAHEMCGLGMTEQALWKALDEKGLLRSVEQEGSKRRRTVRKAINGEQVRVLHLPLSAIGLDNYGDSEPSSRKARDTASEEFEPVVDLEPPSASLH